MPFLQKMFVTQAPRANVLIRIMVGSVFLSEGIQKFLFPDQVGVGRFAIIGIPYPELSAPFVGVVEILCGGLVLIGWMTRLAVVPLIVDMVVAMISTKLPILLGQEFWGFTLRKVPYGGFWGTAHEIRTDWCMMLGSVYLGITGAGKISIDSYISKNRIASG